MFRGVLLVAEISVMVFAYTLLDLIESHVIFACYALLVIALSGPILGESVGWRRWLAVGIVVFKASKGPKHHLVGFYFSIHRT